MAGDRPGVTQEVAAITHNLNSVGQEKLENLVSLGVRSRLEDPQKVIDRAGGRENLAQIFRNALLGLDADQRRNTKLLYEIQAAALSLFGSESQEYDDVANFVKEFTKPPTA